MREELEVTGPVKVTLYASSDAPDTDFVAKLIDVYPDGRAINMCDGILRARYREGLLRPAAAVDRKLDGLYLLERRYSGSRSERRQSASARCFVRVFANRHDGQRLGGGHVRDHAQRRARPRTAGRGLGSVAGGCPCQRGYPVGRGKAPPPNVPALRGPRRPAARAGRRAGGRSGRRRRSRRASASSGGRRGRLGRRSAWRSAQPSASASASSWASASASSWASERSC